jgi:thiamine-monophosphate kinase
MSAARPRRGSELERIALLRAVLDGAPPGFPAAPRVLVGIGDDAAVIAPGAEPLVWTVDCAVEGVHFRRDLMSFEDLGYRATMAAASDLAAMGAVPLALLAALVLPDDLGDDDLTAIARGQRAACDALGTAIVGGNLARGSELSITTTALGATPLPLRRDGARPGDLLALAGPVGLAAAGLRLLDRRGSRDDPALPQGGDAAERALQAFRRPLARIEAGLRARAAARAAIDVSDGLAADLAHLARASGVRAVLDPQALITPDLAALAALLGVAPLELALHGGEDYALIVAGPHVDALPGFTPIGRCAPAEEGVSEVALLAPDGHLTPVPARGFDHFR